LTLALESPEISPEALSPKLQTLRTQEKEDLELSTGTQSSLEAHLHRKHLRRQVHVLEHKFCDDPKKLKPRIIE
jgi:hypothetical protein